MAWADVIAEKARDNPGLRDVDIDFNQNQPQQEITIDRERAQELGVSAEDIGATLETMLGGVTDTTFMERGEEYDVFLRAREDDFTSAVDPDDRSYHGGWCHSSAAGLRGRFRVPVLYRGRGFCRCYRFQPVNPVCGASHVFIDGQKNHLS